MAKKKKQTGSIEFKVYGNRDDSQYTAPVEIMSTLKKVMTTPGLDTRRYSGVGYEMPSDVKKAANKAVKKKTKK